MGEIISVSPSLEEEARNKKEGKHIFVNDYEYEVKVEKAWKGVSGDTVSIEIGVQGTACGLGRLKVGQRLLFYAYGGAIRYFFLKAPFATSSCSRTKSADSAVVEALFLDAAARKKDPTPIYRQLPTILKSHGNPLYRAAAARYLAFDAPPPFPEGTLDALLSGLKDRNPMVRSTVAQVIAFREFEKYRKIWGDALHEAFKAEEKLLRKNGDSKIPTGTFRSIAGALVVYGDRAAKKKTIPYFIQDLKSKNYSIRSDAINRLRAIGPDAQAAVPILKQMLESEDYYIPQDAMRALTVIQAQGPMDELVKALDHKECAIVAEAVKALDRIESPRAKKIIKEKGVPRLIEKINSSSCSLTHLYFLEELGIPFSPYIPQLIEGLDKTRNSRLGSWDRKTVIRILGRIGPKAHLAVPVLKEALNDSDDFVRSEARSALKSIAGWSPQPPQPTLAELQKKLAGPMTQEWHGVARKIKNLGTREAWAILNKEVVPRLIRKWNKGKLNGQESRSLIQSLSILSPQAQGVVPVFIEALSGNQKNWTQTDAFYGLEKLGEQAGPAVPKLIELLNNVDTSSLKTYRDSNGYYVVRTLKSIGTPEAEQALREHARKYIPRLLQQLVDGRQPRSFYYLAQLFAYSDDLLPRLIELFEKEEDLEVRQEILGLIIGPKAKSVAPRILSILKGEGIEDEKLWQQIVQTVRVIKKLGPEHSETAQKRSALLKLLKGPELVIRMHGMEFLMAVGTPEVKKIAEQYRRRILPHLKEVLTCDYKRVRRQALNLLRPLSRDSKTAVRMLISTLGDDDGRVRYQATHALFSSGPQAAPAVPVLATLWDDEYSSVRNLIPGTLKAIGTPEALQALP